MSHPSALNVRVDMSSPEPPNRTPAPLGDLADAAVRAALASADDPGTGDERLVRAAVRALCDEAHRRGVPAERLLVLVKERWWQHAGARIAARAAAGDAVARLVTLCIREFYRWGTP